MAIDHEAFMRVAMEDARRAGAEGNLAVGSVVVRDGRVIGRGTHAELVATSRRYRRLYELDLQQPAASLST